MALDRNRPTLTVCRGCCCGTAKKHPDIDHDAQLAALRQQVSRVADLRVTDCLGPCERSNVVVASPSAGAHRRGGRPIWLGSIVDEAAVSAIGGWLREGGPGLAELPTELRGHRFDRPRAR